MKILNKLKTHQKIFIFSILVVASIALFDILSMNSGVFGCPMDYISGNYTEGWWNLFFQFNSILIILVSLAYYFFGKHDKSESISLLFSSYILWFSGLPDLLFFWFQRLPIPSELPWLNNGIIIGKVANILNSGVVTKNILFISTVLGLIVSYYLIKYLKNKW